MAHARRCSQCSTDWPFMSAYVDCPICEGETWVCTDSEPLTHLQSQQIIQKHRDEYARLEANERAMDAAFDGWFLRQHGIVDPSLYLANRSHGAPLCELLS